MPYENYTDDELAQQVAHHHAVVAHIGDEQELRRNAKPAIGTIYKHRHDYGDKGFWVVMGYSDVGSYQVEMNYCERGRMQSTSWSTSGIRDSLIEQTLTTKEEGKS